MDLSGKLKRLREERTPSAKPAAAPVSPPEILEFTFPPELELGDYRVADLLALAPDRIRLLCGEPQPLGSDPGRLVFWDTETTGLGGSGTIVFLVGLLTISPAGLTITQLFLPEPGAEQDYLKLVSEKMGNDPILVSYNGRAFDSHVLENRFILNRMAVPRPPAHLDLIYPTRNAWRKIREDCTLKTIERTTFCLNRPPGDIPGALIPAQYAEWVRSRDRSLIEPILEHNRFDLLSLALLALHLPRVLDTAPQTLPPAGRILLGLKALRSDDMAEGEKLLLGAFAQGDPMEKIHAFRHLKRLYRMYGRIKDRQELTERLYKETDGLPEAAVEWAKVLEHEKRDCKKAAVIIKDIITILPENSIFLPPLKSRLSRLKKKSVE